MGITTQYAEPFRSKKVARYYGLEETAHSMDDTAANVIRTCSLAKLLVMYVSKMVSTTDKARFPAFGREFSGTIATGQKVRTHRQHYKPGGEDDLNVRNIQQTALMMVLIKTIEEKSNR